MLSLKLHFVHFFNDLTQNIRKGDFHLHLVAYEGRLLCVVCLLIKMTLNLGLNLVLSIIWLRSMSIPHNIKQVKKRQR